LESLPRSAGRRSSYTSYGKAGGEGGPIDVTVENIGFSYGGIEALRGASFNVSSGEFAGIIGPNGSGKTTLLKCIDSVLVPERGRVLIGSRNVKEFSRREIGKTIAVVPQTSAIDFAFTVRDIVLMGRTPHIGRFDFESKKDSEIAEETMGLAGVTCLADRLYDELSGGERQRVIIARALTQQPKILLLDEPTVHLDMGVQYEILDIVQKLCTAQGITVIGVFHDLNLAAQYCGRLVLLNGGRVVASGKPDEVLTPETIRGAYGIDVLVKKHPMTGKVFVTPYHLARHSGKELKAMVHLICGGGSGAPLMKTLKENGFSVSAGVLHTLDTDYEVAKALDIPVAVESPFSQVGKEAYDSNMSLIRKSDAVIVADFPVGNGNLENISAAMHAMESGIPVILICTTPPNERDFTGGKFTGMYDELSRKAVMVSSHDEVIKSLRKVLFSGNGLRSRCGSGKSETSPNTGCDNK
jgi:iron complex transport system ATP-binding protein